MAVDVVLRNELYTNYLCSLSILTAIFQVNLG